MLRRFFAPSAARPTARRSIACLKPPAPVSSPGHVSTSRSRLLASRGAATLAATPAPALDWDTLGFGLTGVAPLVFRATYRADTDSWESHGMEPYAPLPVYPSAQVLNYGQSIFEGLKAQRSAKGRIVLFRPLENARRMADGADRLLMPPPPEDLFLEAVESVVRANKEWVPPYRKGSLYLRPLLLGTGPILGVGPAPSFTLVVFAAAVGAYFKSGQLTPIDLLVETDYHRAAPRGTGATKCAGNYSPGLVRAKKAKDAGYADVVYLDAKTDTLLEEVSSCNIFVVQGRVIRTPPLTGSILPGVTRRSVIALAQSLGYEVREEAVPVADAMRADEVFTTGTAVVLSSVGSLTLRGERRQYGQAGQAGPVALQLYQALTGIQSEEIEDSFGWVHLVKA
ncbi:hypothetical protein H632_c1787p0 [Helicosporidium sp. ATCC 50920]|nr:hypothetical protein H632_c1787p0 [Helicosporidium sp. ATCC 50920]|eukprot:KDD73849.1 hypothetical protein H632_c1787p0 [Helicosporidium sp. ATCC 50920]